MPQVLYKWKLTENAISTQKNTLRRVVHDKTIKKHINKKLNPYWKETKLSHHLQSDYHISHHFTSHKYLRTIVQVSQYQFNPPFCDKSQSCNFIYFLAQIERINCKEEPTTTTSWEPMQSKVAFLAKRWQHIAILVKQVDNWRTYAPPIPPIVDNNKNNYKT